MPSRVWNRVGVFAVLFTAGLAGLFARPAGGHMTGFTGDFRYGTENGCGGILPPYEFCAPAAVHSYGYQSVLSLESPGRQVMSTICNPNVCRSASNLEFVRKCWPPWHAYKEGPSQLNCHDQDGTSHTAHARNDSPVGSHLRAHPFY